MLMTMRHVGTSLLLWTRADLSNIRRFGDVCPARESLSREQFPHAAACDLSHSSFKIHELCQDREQAFTEGAITPSQLPYEAVIPPFVPGRI